MARNDPFGLGSPDFGFGPTKPRKKHKIKPTKRGTLYTADKEKILQLQKGKCAGKTCAKEHGKKLPVNIRSHFDHKKPLALGGKDTISNLQSLCANCHQRKTREDRKKISIAKKGGRIKSTSKRKTRRKQRARRTTKPFGLGNLDFRL